MTFRACPLEEARGKPHGPDLELLAPTSSPCLGPKPNGRWAGYWHVTSSQSISRRFSTFETLLTSAHPTHRAAQAGVPGFQAPAGRLVGH